MAITTKDQLKTILDDAKKLAARAETAVDAAKEIETKSVNEIQTGARGSTMPVLGAESDEVKAMRAFGCSNVKQLVHVNTGLPKFRDVQPYHKHLVRQLKESVDVSRYVAQMFYGAGSDHIGKNESQDRTAVIKNLLETNYGRNELAPRLKAFTSTGVGSGDEWVPTLMAASYVEEYQLPHVLEDKFSTVQMTSNPFLQPVQSGLKKAHIIAENAAITDTTFTTGQLSFSATKLGEYHILPDEMTQDSAPDILAAAREHLIISQIRAVESAIINGDNDGTHIDSDTQAGAADLAEKSWKGLRRQAIANSANGSTLSFAAGAVTETLLRQLRGRMKRHGSLPTDLLWIAGPLVYQQLVGLTNVATVDKFGPMATVLNGALAAYQGIPIVNSEHMREDLNATGVYDGVTTNLAGILIVNLKRWFVGVRRPIVIKAMVDLPSYDRFLLASYQRKDFQGIAQGASEISVAYGYNIAI